MSFIRRIPVPIAALALGVASLGNLLGGYSPLARTVCGLIAGTLAALLLLRAAFDLAGVRADLRNPALLAVSPTLPMALMVLSTYLKPVAGGAAFALWSIALVVQFAIVGLFLTRVVAARDLGTVLPSWFVVFVGYVVGAVTSPAFSMEPVGRVLVLIGTLGYVAALPVVIYRMVKRGDLPEPVRPTVVIFAAPASLLLAGYLAVTDVKQAIVVYALLAVSAVSFAYALVCIPRILARGFHPGYAALTFPVVITAIALKQSAAFLTGSAAAVTIPGAALVAMDGFAVLLVGYVLARYVTHLVGTARA